MVKLVTKEKFSFIVQHLSKYNRFSFGRGINEAKEWIKEELKKLGGIKRKEQPFDLNESGDKGYNIIADLKTNENSEFYIISAHYDSTSNESGNERKSPGKFFIFYFRCG